MLALPPLWAHQAKAVELAKTRQNLALLFDVGTGKTRTMVEILRGKFNEKQRNLPTLIFAPKSVCPQWKTEFEKFSQIDPGRILVALQAGKKRVELLKKMALKYNRGIIVVTNYEAVGIPDFYRALKDWAPEIVILDESHRCKDPTSKRSKLIAPLADEALHRYIMTGTPVLNSPLDLYGQYRLLDRGDTFGRNFFHFRAKYFWDQNGGMPKAAYFPSWMPRKESYPALAKVIAATAVQAKKSECLDLPPLLKVEIPVEMGAEQAKAYEEMRKEFITWVKEQPVTAEFAMTKVIRMQQILAGFVKTLDGEEIWFNSLPRLAILADLLEDLCVAGKQKVVVWTTFTSSYPKLREVCKKLGIESAEVVGGQSVAARQDALEAFCKGSADVLIANPAAGGTGINLIESSTSIYYTRNYSLEQYLQSEARNYRGGSEMHQKVTHYHLVTKNTLDEVVLRALQGKFDMSKAVLAWGKSEAA